MLLTTEVAVKLGKKTDSYYESKGYIIPKEYDKRHHRWHVKEGTTLKIKVNDLLSNSKITVEALCDYCKEEHIFTTYQGFNRGRHEIDKDCCLSCKFLKQQDIIRNRYGVDFPSQTPGTGTKIKEALRKDFTIIQEAFIKSNFKLLSTEKEYENADSILRFICLKHEKEGEQTCNSKAARYERGNGCIYCVREIHIETTPRGKDSPHYNINMTDEDRKKHRIIEGYDSWRLNVYKRDNYLCQCCGKKATRKQKIHAHHLYNYADNADLRTDIDNGITLCRECHYGFHSKYGKKDNTPEQYEEFKLSQQFKNNIVQPIQEVI